jgi:hypothetical protein
MKEGTMVLLEVFEILRIIAFICWSMFLVWTILGVVCLTYKPKKAKGTSRKCGNCHCEHCKPKG